MSGLTIGILVFLVTVVFIVAFMRGAHSDDDNAIGEEAAEKKLRANGELAARLLAWKAAGEPEVYTGNDGEGIRFYQWNEVGEEDEAEAFLFKTGITSLPGFLRASQDQLTALGAYLVTTLNKGELIDLCQFLGITIDDYRIDEHYLAEHTAEELSAMLEGLNLAPATYAEFSAAQLAGNLDPFIKSHADLIGVPKAIRFAYERLTWSDDDE